MLGQKLVKVEVSYVRSSFFHVYERLVDTGPVQATSTASVVLSPKVSRFGSLYNTSPLTGQHIVKTGCSQLLVTFSFHSSEICGLAFPGIYINLVFRKPLPVTLCL